VLSDWSETLRNCGDGLTLELQEGERTFAPLSLTQALVTFRVPSGAPLLIVKV